MRRCMNRPQDQKSNQSTVKQCETLNKINTQVLSRKYVERQRHWGRSGKGEGEGEGEGKRERERAPPGQQERRWATNARLGFALCLLASNVAGSFSWAFGYAFIDQYGVCAASTGKKRPNSALASRQEKPRLSCVQFCKNNLDICCLCQCIFAYLYKLLQIMSQQHAKEKLKEFGKCMSWTPHKPHFKDRADSSSFSDLGWSHLHPQTLTEHRHCPLIPIVRRQNHSAKYSSLAMIWSAQQVWSMMHRPNSVCIRLIFKTLTSRRLTCQRVSVHVDFKWF